MKKIIGGLTCVLALTTQAATYYWDNNGTAGGFGTAGGTWAAPTANQWSTDSTGVAAPGASITTSGSDILYFGSDTLALATGSISVSGTVATSQLLFGKVSGPITLNGGTLNLSSVSTAYIMASSAAGSASSTHTINSNISKTNGGALQFGRQNTSGENYIVNGIISGNCYIDHRVNNNTSYVAYNATNTFSGNLSIVTGQANVNNVGNSGVACSLGTGNTVSMGGGGGQAPLLWYTGTSAGSMNRTIRSTSTADNRIVAQDGPLTLTGSLTTSGTGSYNFNFCGTANTGTNTVSGSIGDGPGTINVSIKSTTPVGSTAEKGFWRFSGANTYTGVTKINNGTLTADAPDVASTSGALGNGGRITFLGGTLQYTPNSAGSDYSARILSSSSPITIDTSGQDVTFTNVLSNGNNGGLTKNGEGQLDIKLSSSSYSGRTTINEGTLKLSNTADLVGFNNSANIDINNDATLLLFSDVGGANRTTFNNNSKIITFGSTGSGNFVYGKGNHLWQTKTSKFVTTGGPQNTVSSAGGGFINPQNTQTVNFDVADGTDTVDLLVSVTIGSGNYVKSGPGLLSLRSFSSLGGGGGKGTITINAGTFEVGGAATLKTNGESAGIVTSPITNNGTYSHNSSADQTLEGIISGTGSLLQAGSGMLTLSATNTYSGATSVSNGVLRLTQTQALHETTDLVISTDSGAKIDLDFTGTATVRSLTVDGELMTRNKSYNINNLPGVFSGETTGFVYTQEGAPFLGTVIIVL